MNARILATAMLALAGCTTTPAALADKPATFSVASTRPPHDFATCIAEHIGNADLRNDGEHYWVLVANLYGAYARWDIYPVGTGSRAELRKMKVAGAEASIGTKCA